jgi:O-acetylhomoserine/O-acetylserine sulfhydrylase-like pyridoxal-dependent enzyme
VRISEQGNCILDVVAHATLPRQQHHALALPILQRHHGTLVTFMMNGQYARMWYIG